LVHFEGLRDWVFLVVMLLFGVDVRSGSGALGKSENRFFSSFWRPDLLSVFIIFAQIYVTLEFPHPVSRLSSASLLFDAAVSRSFASTYFVFFLVFVLFADASAPIPGSVDHIFCCFFTGWGMLRLWGAWGKVVVYAIEEFE